LQPAADSLLPIGIWSLRFDVFDLPWLFANCIFNTVSLRTITGKILSLGQILLLHVFASTAGGQRHCISADFSPLKIATHFQSACGRPEKNRRLTQ